MSKWKDEKWGPHKHCKICGNAMPEDATICSSECEERYQAEEKRYKRQQKISYAVIGVSGAMILIFFLVSYLS